MLNNLTVISKETITNLNWPLVEGASSIEFEKAVILINDPPTVYLFDDSTINKNAFKSLPRDTCFKKVSLNYVDWREKKTKHSKAFSTRIFKIPSHIKAGIQDRFPLCCILHFCLDQILGRMSGLRRGGLKTKYGETYVPCSICKLRSSLGKVN